MIIKWTNKFSGEQGYVQQVKKADGHFVNTFDPAEAKSFARKSDITRALNLLAEMGETADNSFEVIEK